MELTVTLEWMSGRWLYAWTLGSTSFGGASLLVPLYAVQLGASPVELGVLASTAAIIGAPGAVLFGRLADQIAHRRQLVLVTLATAAATLALIPLLTDITALVAANAGLWLVSASISPVLTMLVVDDAPEAAWNERIGRLNKWQGYGWAGGLVLGTVWPLVGGRLVGAGAVTRALFWVLAACAGVSFAAAIRTLPRPEPGAHVTSERKVRRVARLLTRSSYAVRGTTFAFSPNRLYWTTRRIHPRRLVDRLDAGLVAYLAAAALFFTGFAAFWAPLPLYLTGSGFDSGGIFLLYLVTSLTSAVSYEWAGRFASRYDVRLLQSGALAVRGVLFPATVAFTGFGIGTLGLAAAGVGFAAIGLTWAVIAVAGMAIVTRLAAPSVRGEALGLYTALNAVAGGVGGVLGGWAATVDYLFAFGVAGGLVVAGATLVFLLEAAPNERPTSADGSSGGNASSAGESGETQAE
jgi:MFS family permease